MTVSDRHEPAHASAGERDEEGPTPGAPAAAQEMRMIDPPPRGDGPARTYLLLGAGFYAGFAVLFIASLLGSRPDKGRALLELLGLADGVNWIIFSLIVAGLLLTFYAAWTVWRDAALLRREEDDVDWVLRRRREGLMLVFAPADEREARFNRGERTIRPGEAAHVETLVDDRVRRVHQSRTEGRATHMPVDELRGIAETRTASYGHVARFASSLLLLLAVLGTFAGVKTALPSLIDAIGATEGAGAGAASIVDPLRAVADAFGGNALALVGAIAVGLMAQGLSVGRRNLLERLELASAEYIYDNRRTHSADPLLAAVETLSATAGEVHNASTAFLGIEGSLEALSESFRTAFGSLNDTLSEVMAAQDEQLHRRTAHALGSLEGKVASLADAVRGNTASYQGLVDRIGERTAESREAVQQMQVASESLGRALQGMLALGTTSAVASDTLRAGIDTLVEGTQRVEERMAAVADAVERTRPALHEVEAAVAGAADRVAGIDARAAASWKAVADDVRGQIAELSRAQPPVHAGRGGALPADELGLLRRIAAAAETPRGPSPRDVALAAMTGVLGAAGVVYVLVHLPGWVSWLLRLVGL
jgi:methyl-accepting chemotaxis protein